MVNAAYTLFELWMRFLFVLLTFVAIFILTYRLRTVSWRNWTSEQKYASCMRHKARPPCMIADTAMAVVMLIQMGCYSTVRSACLR
jgi:hypothetical protein